MAERISFLLGKIIKKEASRAEYAEFLQLLDNPENEKAFKESLRFYLENPPADFESLSEEELDHILQSIFENEYYQNNESELKKNSKIFYLKKWQKIAAAAILILSLGIWFIESNFSKSKLTASKDSKPALKNDIPPGGNKATLTLGDGKIISLDDTGNGIIAGDASAKVIKKEDGLLEYKKAGSATHEIVYNTIATPNGGAYNVVLSDGSKVWLNAASSIYFPTSFAGKERIVVLTGEAYFEVVHNSNQPFKVKVGDHFIEDVGTSFNVNSYNNEPSLKTTLVEGAIQMYAANNSSSKVLLKPGQQASWTNKGDGYKVSSDADLEEVLAWKNGEFVIKSLSIDAIMRQVERWYDVTVEYRNEKPKELFTGLVKRNTPISTVLKMLEYNGVHCRIEGRKVVVM